MLKAVFIALGFLLRVGCVPEDTKPREPQTGDSSPARPGSIPRRDASSGSEAHPHRDLVGTPVFSAHDPDKPVAL